MNAIVKCKLRFAPPVGLPGAKTIIILPLPHPQQIPDWVRDAAGFAEAVKGDNPAIVEVELKRPAKAEYIESKKAAEGTSSSSGTTDGTGSDAATGDGDGADDKEKSKGKGKSSK